MTRFNLKLLLPITALLIMSACGETPSAPEEAAGSIELTAPETTVALGHSTFITAAVLDEDGAPQPDRIIEWTSSDTNVATVDSGLVVGRSAGNVRTTARSDGLEAHVDVTVEGVDYVEVLSNARYLVAGDTVIFIAHGVTRSKKKVVAPVTWSSLDEAVASVSNTAGVFESSYGVVTGKGGGITQIRATIGGIYSESTVSVTAADPYLGTLEITPGQILLPMGRNDVRLTVVARDASGNVMPTPPLRYTPSNPNVSIGPGGLLIPNSPGFAKVTVRHGAVSATTTVQVTDPIPTTGIRVDVVGADGAGVYYVALDGGTLTTPQVTTINRGVGEPAVLHFAVPAGGPYRVRVLTQRPMVGRDPIRGIARTGQVANIMVRSGEVSHDTLTLQLPTYTITAPGSAAPGSNITVSWTIVDPGNTIEGIRGEIHGLTGAVVEPTRTGPNTYSFSTTIQAPATPGPFQFRARVRSFDFFHVHYLPNDLGGEPYTIMIQ